MCHVIIIIISLLKQQTDSVWNSIQNTNILHFIIFYFILVFSDLVSRLLMLSTTRWQQLLYHVTLSWRPRIF